MHIFKEVPGTISEEECWVCICEGYLYTSNSLENLVEVLNLEWKSDKHLVGSLPELDTESACSSIG